MVSIEQETQRIVLPGFATAHSHAFQRALRGRTQRRVGEPGSFWSWRGLMYRLVEKLTPETLFDLSRFAFVELALSGVTAVGEFHYVHHQADGTPYDERTLLADTVVRAAREAGIRITLIRTAYLRAGYKQELEPGQRRFVDPGVEPVLRDVETLRQRYRDDPLVTVALAAHSIRAVPIEAVCELAGYARTHGLPFHMHVAEQRREIEECVAEYGKPPVELLAEHGVLGSNFVAVHATHLEPHEIQLLGQARAFVCLCRTTERDLGDGLPETSELLDAGVRLCVGVDSHASSDAFEELRAVELDERTRTERRTVAAEAPDLLEMGTRGGLEALGLAETFGQDQMFLNANDPSVVGASEAFLADAVVFGATPRAVQQVQVAGKTVVQEGTHRGYDEARTAYAAALEELGLC